MAWGRTQFTMLLPAFMLAGCLESQPVAQWQQPEAARPRTVTAERAYIETPVPAKFVETPPKSGQTASLTTVQPIEVKSAGADGASRLIGMSGAEASKLLGQPTETKESNLSWIWTYRTSLCTLKLFFYPAATAADFRALTYQVEEHKTADADHAACLAQIAKSTPG
jgi:hypothetical protein